MTDPLPPARRLTLAIAGLLAACALVLATPLPAAGQEGGEHDHERGEHDHAGPAEAAARDTPRLRDGLGDHTFPITTESEAARRWFDQGFRLTYAFEHAEAIEAFRRAAELDPGCALCWWGVAWASGPNINAAMDSAGGARAWRAIRKARERLEGVTDRERAFVEAMAARYGPGPTAERAARDSAYARAMRQVAEERPADDDARVLAAEALMLLSPWDYWTGDGEPKPGTEELLEHLETVTARSPDHAGACHFYIHAVEAARPRLALPCAGRIADLMPGAGHIVHMPGHVYIRVGRYADAVEANLRALRADSATAADRTGETVYTLAYHPHNWHFLSYAAAMAGRSGLALEAARELAGTVDREMMRRPGFLALQHYLVTPLRVMVRFGMWEAILAEPAPPDDLLYPRGTWRYARTMALARTGRLDRAGRELERLRGLAAEPALAEKKVWDLNSAAALLGVAVKVAEGELAAARGEHADAIRALREGVRLEEDLVYDEPPPWHLPVRHVLGGVLLEADRAGEAEAVYRRALDRFPENGFALKGLARSLEDRGRGDEAAAVRERLATAWRSADVELPGSRF